MGRGIPSLSRFYHAGTPIATGTVFGGKVNRILRREDYEKKYLALPGR